MQLRFSPLHLWLLVGGLGGIIAAAPAQRPFSADAVAGPDPTLTLEVPFPPSPRGEFDRTQTLAPADIIAAQHGSFVRLVHRDIPGTSVRIKRHPRAWEDGQSGQDDQSGKLDPRSFCDPSVTSWTGFIDTVDGRSLFFFFFESRSSPQDDPVLMWTNGGPGGSGSLGLFMEHGPCRAVAEDRAGPPINGTDVFGPSWNQKANVIYIEQPAGVGYSYVRFGEGVASTPDAARDIYHFFRIFFAAFEQFRDNDFHLSGESFGGRYVPEFAREIVDRDLEVLAKAKREGKVPEPGSLLNLKSIIIGNGYMKVSNWWRSLYDTGCTTQAGEGPPKLSIGECARIKPWVARCEKFTRQYCEEDYTKDLCGMWGRQCENELLLTWYHNPTRNPFDLTDFNCTAPDHFSCYVESDWLERYLDRDDVRSLLGAPSLSELPKYESTSDEVSMAFEDDFWLAGQSFDLYAQLLERGVKALIYVGRADFTSNYLYALRSVELIEHPGKIDVAKSFTDWHHEGRVIGQTATGGNLTFTSFYGAGHMVPYKLENAWPAVHMLNRWLADESL